MPASVLRRIACDAGIVLVATTGRLPIDVGHLQRRPTTAQRRALHVRDRTCRFPGCDTHHDLHARPPHPALGRRRPGQTDKPHRIADVLS